MFKQLINKTLLFNKFKISVRNLETNSSKEKWDLLAGVFVERLPVLTKSLTKMENEFKTHLNQVEFEQSLKSDHEIRFEKDLLHAELIKKGEMDLDLDVDHQKQTAQDMEDACTEEFNKFQFSPRKTEADKKNDIKSVNRKLEEILVLLVDQKIGNENFLLLPQGKHRDGESLRQTAERVLIENSGGKLDVLFFGNAPCGFYKYKYPANQRKEAVGAKIFFFRSILKNGNITEGKIKYEWLDKIELEKKLKKPYFESISQFMF